MKKNFILLTLLLFSLAVKAGNIEIDGKYESFDGEILFSGTVAEFSKNFDDENTTGQFKFKVSGHKSYLVSAERIARLIWKKLWPDGRTEPPFPCGYHLTGSITAADAGSGNYKIFGTGNGGGDSCTGGGGPGHWSFYLKVSYDSVSNTGYMKIESFTE